MKCPLLLIAYLLLPPYKDGTNRPPELCDCCKEQCAWWDEVGGGRCAFLSLVGSLDDIAVKLMHIEGNMGVKK